MTLKAAEAGQLSIQLEPAPAPASAPAAQSSPAGPAASLMLLVTSNEVGADLYVDDARAGTVPMSVPLPVGKHSIKVVPK